MCASSDRPGDARENEFGGFIPSRYPFANVRLDLSSHTYSREKRDVKHADHSDKMVGSFTNSF